MTKWSRYENDILLRLCKLGMSYEQMTNHLDRSKSSIENQVKKRGIPYAHTHKYYKPTPKDSGKVLKHKSGALVDYEAGKDQGR
jgi:hypothetical protein